MSSCLAHSGLRFGRFLMEGFFLPSFCGRVPCLPYPAFSRILSRWLSLAVDSALVLTSTTCVLASEVSCELCDRLQSNPPTVGVQRVAGYVSLLDLPASPSHSGCSRLCSKIVNSEGPSVFGLLSPSYGPFHHQTFLMRMMYLIL